MTTTAAKDGRAAIDKAISALISLREHGDTGLGVSELARRAGLSKSTAFRVLGTLVRNDVVEKVGDRYRLGARLHDLGTSVYGPEHAEIRDVVTPFLADLYEMTHQTVHLAALHDADVVYLAKLFGHRSVTSPSRVGGRVPAHCTAVGKVLMAFTSESFDLIVDADLTSLTPRSVTDPVKLSKQLVRIRREGVAFDDEEAASRLNCVAAPVFGIGRRAVAALSVSGPVGSFDPRAQAAPLRRVALAASQAVRQARIGSSLRYSGAQAS